MTDIQLKVIDSINQQAIELSKHDALHYETVSELYKETVNIQFLILANSLDIEQAQEALKKGENIFKRENKAAIKALSHDKEGV